MSALSEDRASAPLVLNKGAENCREKLTRPGSGSEGSGSADSPRAGSKETLALVGMPVSSLATRWSRLRSLADPAYLPDPLAATV